MANYPIDPDVRRIALRFAGNAPAMARLIQAVERAEGDILKAVKCSLPDTTTREQALEITCRSAVHAMVDFIAANNPDAFVNFWAARWAPEGVANDPHNLNKNWPANVSKLWGVKP